MVELISGTVYLTRDGYLVLLSGLHLALTVGTVGAVTGALAGVTLRYCQLARQHRATVRQLQDARDRIPEGAPTIPMRRTSQ